MQNGNPAKLMIIHKATNKIEKEMELPTRNPAGVHGQFRHIRITKAGTFLVAHLDLGKVVARQNRLAEAEALDRQGLTALRNFVERGDHRIEEAEAQLAEVVRAEGRADVH